MSWHIGFTTTVDASRADLETARAEAISQNPECGDQFNAARDACLTILLGQSVGSYDKKFSIALSGHANPDHQPRPGWANDCVTVSVAQA